MEVHRSVDWAIEVVALAGCAALIGEDHVTIYGTGFRVAAVAITALVLGADVAAFAARISPSRLAPLCLVLFAQGLVGSGSARVSVWVFAFGALLPLAVRYAIGPRFAPLLLDGALAIVAIATVFVRIRYRDPFRELRCVPACVLNPDLRAYAPHLVRGAERVLAVLVVIWVLAALRRLVRRGSPADSRDAAVFASLGAAVLMWAARLFQQPRPLPDDVTDRWLSAAELTAIGVAAALIGYAALGVAVARWRIVRDARSLSNAATVESITGHLRHATGDPDLRLHLGPDGASTQAATSVLRGGRVVATIDHRPGARQRVAAAVTPAIALALETQLLLAEARQHLAELERSRARVVETTDAARRRLERDLHDGAQQRLLVVGMRLAHVADKRPVDEWRTVIAHVANALGELRRIGRGDAAIIAELGFEDAVTALAGTSPVLMQVRTSRCIQEDHDCWPQTSATAIYRLVVGSVADAEAANAEELAVELRCLGGGLGHKVITRHRGPNLRDRLLDHDRVVACGGRVVTDDDGVFEAWLP